MVMKHVIWNATFLHASQTDGTLFFYRQIVADYWLALTYVCTFQVQTRPASAIFVLIYADLQKLFSRSNPIHIKLTSKIDRKAPAFHVDK